ncbi:MAG: hypothetical protein LBI31_07490 [Zoogloeaceae bacterium]|jgi:hypothetical protein|nr:hypothetical protein [Zoogloeaceae bacterium]
MTYRTGIAQSFTDVRDAIVSAASDAGWTNHGGGALWRPGCAVKLTDTGTHLNLLGGTDFANGDLVSPAPNVVRMGTLMENSVATPIAFPALYDVMAFPEEVYCFINHNVLEYQYLAFGQGNVPGLPGTGAWVSGTLYYNSYSGPAGGFTGMYSFALGPTSGGAITPGSWQTIRSSGAIFADQGNYSVSTHAGQICGSFVHHGLTDAVANPWSLGDILFGQGPLAPLLEQQPSNWNEGAALLPLRAYLPRPGGFMSLVADLRYARNVRIDNLDPKAVYNLGTDRWKIFPWVKKELAARNGGGNINHSGTLGVAICYDGP